MENFPGLLDDIINLERFVQVTGHRFLAIDVLARLERIDGHLRVNRIMGSDQDGIQIFALEHLPIVDVHIGIGQPGLFLRPVPAFVKHLGCSHDLGVVLVGFLVDAQIMVLADTSAHADHANINPVVSTGNVG
ncbi:hypothetical protein SDC9_190786 [bioreactor metagenome]|uniref:Uncharacterized protein n=1 Tax=bioreactor metagenome TaxID=1076179 RepID=A0A645HW63_9ZZZZ